MREEIDFASSLIVSYGYEVYLRGERLCSASERKLFQSGLISTFTTPGATMPRARAAP